MTLKLPWVVCFLIFLFCCKKKPTKQTQKKQPNTAIANIGILYLKNTTINLITEWEYKIREDLDYWDQNCFNDLIKRGGNTEHSESLIEGVSVCYNESLRCSYLSIQVAGNGHSYFIQGFRDDAFFVHATFVFSATAGKRNRYREALLWRDSDNYYNSDRKYITIDLHIPPLPFEIPTVSAAWDEGNLNILFNVMNAQLNQIRSALALAMSLNRTLVMPRLRCVYDRVWYPHEGVFPGSELLLPFDCPMDHVFNIEKWISNKIQFREYSFLNNSATPKLKSSIISNLSSLSTEVQAKSWEASTGHAIPVVHFSDLRDLNVTSTFFPTPHKFNSFVQKTMRLTSHWCCVRPPNGKGPGHIWYDLWYDLIPHTDMHQRVWNNTWTEVLGP